MLAAGIGLIVAAMLLVIGHVFARKRAGALLASRPRTVSELVSSAKAVAKELGEPGGSREMVTLRGRPQGLAPLESPLGKRGCAYYAMTVSREYEETYEERDNNNQIHRRLRRGSDTMSTQSESRDFHLDDGTGAALVRLDGARFDGLLETVDRFEPAESGPPAFFGQFNLSFHDSRPNRRTLGFKYREEILPFDATLTVVGQTTDGSELTVGRGGLAFLVSTRTREEMLGSAQRNAQVTAALSGIAALAGVVLTIIGAVT